MTDAQSFTPLQRRKCLTFASHRRGNENIKWTATRCQRLLRPITSRIEVLKKNPLSLKPEDIDIKHIHGSQAESVGSKFQSEQLAPASDDKDPAWAPERKRIRIKRTYGRPRASQEELQARKSNRSLAPGEILVSTPMLNRINSSTPKSQESLMTQSIPAAKNSEPRLQPSEIMKRISKTTHPVRFALYEGLYNALETLLKATVSTESDLGVRPRSLFSLCLNNVPSYIKLEEKWVASEVRETRKISTLDQRDSSTEIYADLESLGTSEKGWKNLKVVVRAHGIRFLKDAIAENLIGMEFTSALVMLCTHSGCQKEAANLLSSLLEKQFPAPISLQTSLSTDGRMLPITMLATFAKRGENRGYQYRELSHLFKEGRLPQSWLANKDFSPIWTSVFHSLSKESPNGREATSFLEVILPLLCEERMPRDQQSFALDAILASAVRTIASMCILHQINTSNPDKGRSLALRDLLRCIMVDSSMLSCPLNGNNVSLIAIANLVIISLGDLSIDEQSQYCHPFIQIIQQASNRSQNADIFEETLSQFLCSIARCCGRCSTDKGFEHLRFIIGRIESAIALPCLDTSRVLSRVAVQCGFTFCQQLPDKKHVHYAEDLESKLWESSVQLRESSSRTDSGCKSDFRWEEGISEWVTATPTVSIQKKKATKVCSSHDESEAECPRKMMRTSPRQESVAGQGKLRVCDRRPLLLRISDLTPPSPDACTEEYDESQTESVGATDEECYQSRLQRYSRFRRTRKSVTRTRRFGHDLLRPQQEWRLFEDESDDELNSSLISHAESITTASVELQNSSMSNNNRLFATRMPTEKSRPRTFCFELTGDSEDELSVLGG